jgi:hypothetical protein
MKADTASGRKIRQALEKRLAGVETFVIDEGYFLGAANLGVASEYCSIAKGQTIRLEG